MPAMRLSVTGARRLAVQGQFAHTASLELEYDRRGRVVRINAVREERPVDIEEPVRSLAQLLDGREVVWP
jgi:hypothetical protein